jgi:hypothetical protein
MSLARAGICPHVHELSEAERRLNEIEYAFACMRERDIEIPPEYHTKLAAAEERVRVIKKKIEPTIRSEENFLYH